MSQRVVDVTLENLFTAPPEVLDAVFWELDIDSPVEPRFEKEEWFSSTLLEWGPCGKLVVEEGLSLGFAQYAPATLFPRIGSFAAGAVSADAAYLSYCYVVAPRRGEGLGTYLARVVARELADRGYRAVEALGDHRWDGSWVLPAPFLAAAGFHVLRDDPRYPLMRLDLRAAVDPEERADAAEAAVEREEAAERAVMLPAPGAA
jgi:GNAT superfamily N-acetyltransferase